MQIWLEEQGENSFAISAYCEKLLPMLREAEGRVWWMLTTLTDQVLGEISHMWYIDDFDVLEEPKAEPSFPLSQLPDKLKEKGANLTTDPEAYLDSYLGYEMEPNKDPDADWRLDVMAGSTCCVPLINGYLNADNDFMDALHADGAVAGFLCYPLDTLREEEGSDKIFDFRDRLEEAARRRGWPGDPHPHWRGHRPLLRLCGLHRLGHPELALQMAKEFFEGSGHPLGQLPHLPPGGRHCDPENIRPRMEPDDEEQDHRAGRNADGHGLYPLHPGRMRRTFFAAAGAVERRGRVHPLHPGIECHPGGLAELPHRLRHGPGAGELCHSGRPQ